MPSKSENKAILTAIALRDDLAVATQRAEEAEDESAGLAGVVLDLAAAVERLLPIAEVRLRETEEHIPAEEVADDDAAIRAGKAALELARELQSCERTETTGQKYRDAVKVMRELLAWIETTWRVEGEFVSQDVAEDWSQLSTKAEAVLAKAED